MESKNNLRPELTRNYLVVFILSKLVGQLFGCKLVPFNNSGNQVKYPFVTYHQIEVHQYTTADHVANQFNCQLQLDCFSSDPTVATNMAEALLDSLLNDDGYRRWFEQANVVPFPLPNQKSDIRDHTTLPGIEYAYRYGFYINFTIGHADTVYQEKDLDFTYHDDTIESVQVNSEVDGDKDTINAKKEEN